MPVRRSSAAAPPRARSSTRSAPPFSLSDGAAPDDLRRRVSFCPAPCENRGSSVQVEDGRHLGHSGSEDDQEERREDKEDHREHHLHRGETRELLGPLTALRTKLQRLILQDLRETHPQRVGLDDRVNEAPDIGKVCSPRELTQRLLPVPTHLELEQQSPELIGERVLPPKHHLSDRAIERKSGISAQREHVERRHERLSYRVLPFSCHRAQDEPRDGIARGQTERYANETECR